MIGYPEVGCPAGHQPESDAYRPASPGPQQYMDGQIGVDEGLKGVNKRGVAQAGKPRAIKTPIQKEALEAAFRSMFASRACPPLGSVLLGSRNHKLVGQSCCPQPQQNRRGLQYPHLTIFSA